MRWSTLRCACGVSQFSNTLQTCASCGTSLPTDDLAVVRLGTHDVPWHLLPAGAAASLRHAEHAEEIVNAMLDDDDTWPRDFQTRLLHPANGVAATLVPVRPGTAALDLATGWATLPVALRSLGANVAVADWSLLRLRFGQLMHEPPPHLAVHVDIEQPLPWADASFDFAFVDLGEVQRASANCGSILREIRRVLTDDGIAVIGAHSWLRGGSLRLRSRLRRQGFSSTRIIVPIPQRKNWRYLTSSAASREYLSGSTDGRGLKAVIESLTMAVGKAHWLAPDWFILASYRDSGDVLQTLSETLVTSNDDFPLTFALSDARVAVAGADTFVKVPLSEHQKRAIVREAKNTQQARETGFRPFVVPADAVKYRHTTPYAEYPLIRTRPASPKEIEDAIEMALREVAPVTPTQLRTTALWRRLTNSRGARDAADIGADKLRLTLLECYGDAVLPVGPTHGDLRAANVLLPETGPPLLVDWNRFERANPLLLDAGYAAVRGHMKATNVPFWKALVAFASGDLDSSLAMYADTVLGDLDRAEAATVILLDRVVSYSLPRRRHKPWTMAWIQRAVRSLDEYTQTR
jgi:ubiquinone/menaquinone biosynthesis C-methylase UbiE